MAKDNFGFWCPIQEVEKAIDEKTGEEIMLLGGIASTADEDSDGEFLDPKGFDIKPLLKSGLVNWHHQARTHPGTIVGEPTKAEIRKEGLYIETQLYPHSQVACDIWNLAKTLASDSKTRRLGYSIEGKVVKRKSEDPTNPDYKKIVKAIITGVAITHMPKNPKTFANIIKGDIDDDIDGETEDEEVKEKEETTDQEEAVDTESAAALKKESVDDNLKILTFSKSDVFDRLFSDIPGISISKAKKIYTLIEQIAMKKEKSTAITQDDITKAYEALGITMPEDDVVFVKGDDEEDDVGSGSEDDDESDEEFKKKHPAPAAAETSDDDDESDEDEDDDSNEEDEDEDDDTDEDEDDDVKKAETAHSFQRIEEAIARSHKGMSKYVKALGVIVKAQTIKLEKAQQTIDSALETINSQNDIIKGYEEQFATINEQLSSFGSAVPAPKSVRHARPVERVFKAEDADINKGGDGGSDAKQQVSIKNRRAVSEILDEATFFKGGYDEEFSKACTAFEAGADLTPGIIARIKNEFGIEIVK